ncbi:MAG: hypothetical protein WAN66_14175 [Limnoraphis robusta]|uniref:Uncharacterized protein n=1 Tax=Limnoraphis robusta CS-951 TaxID=1637645 RepID=A0A0F5YIN7_9CYAN|nr:hypothetical protein [Limnoraphis robusta]KKD38789.1 hypothetical protein WN50_07020 [Limnoraphis robusta CS-951]
MDYQNVILAIDSRLQQEEDWNFSYLTAALWWLKSDSDRRFQEALYYLTKAEVWDIASMLQKYIDANSKTSCDGSQ